MFTLSGARPSPFEKMIRAQHLESRHYHLRRATTINAPRKMAAKTLKYQTYSRICIGHNGKRHRMIAPITKNNTSICKKRFSAFGSRDPEPRPQATARTGTRSLPGASFLDQTSEMPAEEANDPAETAEKIFKRKHKPLGKRLRGTE